MAALQNREAMLKDSEFKDLTSFTSEWNSNTVNALKNLLYRLADDELIIGHRNSEWTGHAPILEEDIAFSSMAQDEMGHSLMYYELLHGLGEKHPDKLGFGRKPGEFTSCSLVSLPNRDWGVSIVRQFLYDAAEAVRLRALTSSSFTPLAELSVKLQSEEKYHYMHGLIWMKKLSSATEESNQIMQNALNHLWPHALGMFESVDDEKLLIENNITVSESDCKTSWLDLVTPVINESTLTAPQDSNPVYGGRKGQQSDDLKDLLENMTVVYNIDPDAKW